MIILLNLLLATGLALLLAKTAERAKLPRLLGMMLAGVMIGKYTQSVLSHKLPAVVAETVFLSPSVFLPLQRDPFLDLNLFSLSWSTMLKKLALIVILIRDTNKMNLTDFLRKIDILYELFKIPLASIIIKIS